MSFVTVLPQVPYRKIFYSLRHLPLGNCANMYPSYSLIQFQLAVSGYNPLKCSEAFLGFWCTLSGVRPSHAQEHLNSPAGIFTFSMLRTRIHLHKTESCFLDPNRDTFELSFSEQPRTPKSQGMGPDLNPIVTWFHIPAILFSQKKIFC